MLQLLWVFFPNCICLYPDNNIVILVVCGCAALGLIVIMGIAMKIKMHRDKGEFG